MNVTAKVFKLAPKIAHASNFINSGVNKVTLFKAAAHGLTRGVIQSAQGGSFKAGFVSGFSSGLDVGTTGYGGFVGRTVISGIVGGTVSVLGGGKFSNGAMSGAMVHMFNMEAAIKDAYKKLKGRIETFFTSHPKATASLSVDDIDTMVKYMQAHAEDNNKNYYWAVVKDSDTFLYDNYGGKSFYAFGEKWSGGQINNLGIGATNKVYLSKFGATTIDAINIGQVRIWNGFQTVYRMNMRDFNEIGTNLLWADIGSGL